VAPERDKGVRVVRVEAGGGTGDPDNETAEVEAATALSMIFRALCVAADALEEGERAMRALGFYEKLEWAIADVKNEIDYQRRLIRQRRQKRVKRRERRASDR